MSNFWYNGVGETAEEREAQYLPQYLVVVIDPSTGNQTDFEIDCTSAWIPRLREVFGLDLSTAMRRLKKRAIIAPSKTRQPSPQELIAHWIDEHAGQTISLESIYLSMVGCGGLLEKLGIIHSPERPTP